MRLLCKMLLSFKAGLQAPGIGEGNGGESESGSSRANGYACAG
jgi:hypothetical protein